MGSGYLGQLVVFAFNLTLYTAEHWTRSFPVLSKFVYDVHFHDFSIFMMLSFFYFSYYNCCGSNQSLLRNWFFAKMVCMSIMSALGIGMPEPTIDEQIEFIENDSVYNISHLVGHCFLFVMAWHVSSVVDVTKGLKKGWLGDKIEDGCKSWYGAAASPLDTLRMSLAVCVGTIIISVVIELMKAADGGRTVVSDQDKCTFMGITIPCFKLFNKETVDRFGMGLEMSAIWMFIVTFAIGLVAFCKAVDDDWITPSWSEIREASSLKITCALYGMETAFFALIRYYWGVCKPLVAAAAVHNLCEWSIVLHMAGNHKELKKYLPMVSFFIAFLVTLCMCVPNLFIALGLEQSFGMMLDFGMPVMFTMQLFDQEKRKIYLLPLLIQFIYSAVTVIKLKKSGRIAPLV